MQKNIKIAYIGGGSKQWARVFMSDLAVSEDLSGQIAEGENTITVKRIIATSFFIGIPPTAHYRYMRIIANIDKYVNRFCACSPGKQGL